jgi:hypothetical protein
MAAKHGACVAVVAGVLAMSGCGSGSESAHCASNSGARACIVRESGKAHIEVTGFRPSSDVQITRDGPANPQMPDPGSGNQAVGSDPAAPMTFRVGADGTNGGGVLGIVGMAGPVTFTLSGIAETGTAVALPLVYRG